MITAAEAKMAVRAVRDLDKEILVFVSMTVNENGKTMYGDALDAVLMTHGIDAVKTNIKAISDNEDATDKDEDLLTTLEVAYEYYLRGFEFLPIDIYKSHATKFLIEDGKLLPPFVSISGLGENAAWDLMRGREGKNFLSVEEVAAACPKVSKTHMQMLKEAGAFGSLPDTSQVSLF